MVTVDFHDLKLKPGSLVLDAGCGGGRHLRALAKLPEFAHASLPDGDRLLVWLLRLAVLLCRSRAEPRLDGIELEVGARRFRLQLPAGWLERRPLTCRALEEEAVHWAAVGLKFPFG